MVLEGDEAVEIVRALNGATDGRKAAPGTIRGDLSLSNRENLVHGSDSEESAKREIALWFPRTWPDPASDCRQRPPQAARRVVWPRFASQRQMAAIASTSTSWSG